MNECIPFQFFHKTRIVFGNGLSKDFAQEFLRLNVSKIFLVADSFWKLRPEVSAICDHLVQSDLQIVGEFYDVPPDGSVKIVEQLAENAKNAGTQAWLVIGGGSAMDTAKAANLLCSLGGNLKEDYSGAQTITQNLAPLIAIPTTAGTGSEVTAAVVLYDEDSQSKLSFVDDHLLPDVAILDPELTIGLPSKMTAATGLDALTHAIEALWSQQKNPLSTALAIQAAREIFLVLPGLVKNPTDLDLRGRLLVAATMAGVSFNNAMVGVVHAVAHSVGAVSRVHHGTANGIFLPQGILYNTESEPDLLNQIALNLGFSSASDLHKNVEALLVELNQICGFPLRFKDVGVLESDLEKIAAKSEEDGASFYNPRPVTADEILPFIKQAWG